MHGIHMVYTAKILKPRQGKAFKIRVYHNTMNNINIYIYVWKNKKAYITKCNYAFLNNYIYLSNFRVVWVVWVVFFPKPRRGKALGRITNA